MNTSSTNTSSPSQALAPISIPGEIRIRTLDGINGRFAVGKLVTHLGVFAVKDRELELFPEGKYRGQFDIRYIFPKAYPSGGGIHLEIRAVLDRMTLHDVKKLTKEDTRQFDAKDVDPIEEEPVNALSSATPVTEDAPAPTQRASNDGESLDGDSTAAESEAASDAVDATLFGELWPLIDGFKLDATANRQRLRQQRDRLYELGYEIDPLTQRWHEAA